MALATFLALLQVKSLFFGTIGISSNLHGNGVELEEVQ
jgi:hypothetical protein